MRNLSNLIGVFTYFKQSVYLIIRFMFCNAVKCVLY